MQEEFLVIDKHWRQVLTYLNQNKLRHFPVHIFIGKENTGKSSLLRQGEINFDAIVPAVKSYKKNLVNEHSLSEHNHTPYEPSEYCHWWIDKKGLILEIPSTFLSCDNEIKNTPKWQYLLKLLCRQKKYLSVCSITYVVDVGFLANLKNEIDLALIYDHKRIVLEFSRELGTKLPLYFLITKCDLVQGFSEFFDDLRSDERTQCLGCPLENNDHSNDLGIHQTLTDAFNINFDKLLNQLNAHIISRINHERNLTKRTIINEFPLQLEMLQDAIAFLLEEIGEKTLYCDATKPHGVYFTSTLQTGQSYDFLQQSLSQAYEFPEEPYVSSITHASRPYFIKNFISDLLASSEILKSKDEKWLKFYRIDKSNKSQLITAASACAFVIFTVSLITWQYQSEKNVINSAKDKVRSLESELVALNQKRTTIHQTMRYVNTLDSLSRENNSISTSWLHPFHLGSHHALAEKIDSINSKLLLSQVKQELESELLNGIDPKQLYHAHKAYWQITHESKTSTNDLAIWAMNHWNNLSDSDQNFIYTSIKGLHVDPKNHVRSNNVAIERTHSILSSIPTAYFAYLSLIDKTNPINISNVAHGIPYAYTKAGFQSFLENLNNFAVDDQLSFIKNSENKDQARLQAEILDLYFKDYASYWNNYINKIFYSPTHLSTILKQLQFYEKNPSSLKASIQLIINNVSPNQLMAITSKISPELNINVKENLDKTIIPMFQSSTVQLSQFMLDSKQFDAVINNFKQLSEYLQVLNETTDQAQMGFELAVLHAKRENLADPLNSLFKLASQQSPFLQQWLQKMADNTWSNILDLTHHYINLRWQQEILPVYNATINNRYPIFSTATIDITLPDFEHFFSSDGILSKFFDHYLSPFVDTSSIQWEWRNINNQTFANDKTLPQLFERARIIRQMFFSNSNKFDFHFSLAATTVEPVVSKIQLTLGDQPLVVTPGQHLKIEFVWPMKQEHASLNVFLNNNQPAISNEKFGPFALFRLLKEAGIQTTTDPTHYLVSFNVSNNVAAQFQLQTESLINPFIPNIIDQFRCPERLF